MLRYVTNQINFLSRRFPPAPSRWSSGSPLFTLIRLGAIAVIVSVTACSTVPASITTSDATPTVSPDSPPSHVPESAPPVFFPQQAPIVGEHEVMTALLFGKLSVVDKCLRINSHPGNTSYVVVWPADVTMRVANDTIHILNQTGHVLAQLGDAMYLGGGEVPASQATALSQQPDLPIDSVCSGPYWLGNSRKHDQQK